MQAVATPYREAEALEGKARITARKSRAEKLAAPMKVGFALYQL